MFPPTFCRRYSKARPHIICGRALFSVYKHSPKCRAGSRHQADAEHGDLAVAQKRADADLTQKPLPVRGIPQNGSEIAVAHAVQQDFRGGRLGIIFEQPAQLIAAALSVWVSVLFLLSFSWRVLGCGARARSAKVCGAAIAAPQCLKAALVYAKHTPQCQMNSKTIFELI